MIGQFITLIDRYAESASKRAGMDKGAGFVRLIFEGFLSLSPHGVPTGDIRSPDICP
jgi:hypothetical protein